MALQLWKGIRSLFFSWIIALLLPVAAFAFTVGDGGNNDSKTTEQDLHAPETGLLYVRQTPAVFFKHAELVNGEIKLVDPVYAWIDQFTSNELGGIEGQDRSHVKTLSYLKKHDIDLAALTQEQEVILPVTAQGWAEHFKNLPPTTVQGGNEAMYVKSLMPQKEAFQNQENGLPAAIAEEYGLTNATAPNIQGEKYFKLEGSYGHEILIHQLEYDTNYMNNWQELKGKAPYWDNWEPNAHYFTNAPSSDPNFKGFYWGREWHPLLGVKDNYGATYTIPGQISAVRPYVDLVLEAPESMQGTVGSTKEIGFKVLNNSNSKVVTDLAWCVNDNNYNWQYISDAITFNPYEEKTYKLPVVIPGTEQSLIIKANVNQEKPIFETSYTNNYKTVKILPEAYDIKVEMNAPRDVLNIVAGDTLEVRGYITITRKDKAEIPLPVKLTITETSGATRVETFTLQKGGTKKLYHSIWTSKPGTYTISAEAWPHNDQWKDIYPKDNKSSITVRVEEVELPPSDSEIRVNLGGQKKK